MTRVQQVVWGFFGELGVLVQNTSHEGCVVNVLTFLLELAHV